MPDVIEFSVPLPPSCLSPNASAHWSQKAAAKREYAEVVWLAGQFGDPGCVPPWYMRPRWHKPWAWAAVHLTWYSIQRKDEDNIIGHCKSLIDGLSSKGQKPLSIFEDDKRITVTAEWRKVSHKVEQCVEVRVMRREDP